MATVTKRQQARNEKELNELLRLPGNNQCADCQARNPGWASWSLGIFLCLRCASIHRKLGTHVSKVKSLSMDTWTGEQVQNMKDNGNVVANKIYNPRNKRPDIPLDADEVDSAMERYIRKKYQEKSLSDGKPLPPARNDVDTLHSRNDMDMYGTKSAENSPPPPLPPKKGRFFGFGLRAVSSAYPLSKHDKKNSPVEPRVDRAFRIGSDSYNTPSRSGGGSKMSDDKLQRQLIVLREMGFRDTQRNTALLRATDGDVERTIATLVKMDKKDARSATNGVAPPAAESTRNTIANTSFPSESEVAKLQLPKGPTNPFDQTPTGQGQTQGLSFMPSQQPQPTGRSYQSEPLGFQSNNPFDMPARSQTDQGLAQAFQGMQISQPLFPHSTGGHPVQPQFPQEARQQFSMSPPVPAVPRQYAYMASPTAMSTSNPFFQPDSTTQNVSLNPYTTQQQPPLQTSNPFFQQKSSPAQQQPSHTQAQQNASYNPFGIPPQTQTQQTFQSQPQAQSQSQSVFDYPQQKPQQPQSAFDYMQSQAFSQQMPQTQPYAYETQQFQHQQQQQTAFPQKPYPSQPLFHTQQQPLMPQQTGRYDKSSILALYNHPQLAPQPSLASIPEPSEARGIALGTGFDMASQKRSATMPVSSMHSAGGGGSRNPFMSVASGGSSAPMAPASNGGGNMVRHASAESVQINNLQNGRHSPDAFASLSARYMR